MNQFDKQILFDRQLKTMEKEAEEVPKSYARRGFLRSLMVLGVAAGAITSPKAILEAQNAVSLICPIKDRLPPPCTFTDKTCSGTHKSNRRCTQKIEIICPIKIEFNCNGFGTVKFECGIKTDCNQKDTCENKDVCNIKIECNNKTICNFKDSCVFNNFNA
jgi:hypothetical protein